MSSETLKDLVQKWLRWDKDPSTAAEIKSLWERATNAESSEKFQSEAELEKRLRNHIQFGTAGLRGRMQAGFAFMNCLTVIQASQGLAQYVLSSGSSKSPKSVIIGHDTRHQSARFARLAANAFLEKGIKVHLFGDYVPTPFVAFGVKVLSADAGIMITASHNPAMDNGYKVYQSNGAQINTPVDAEIANAIQENLTPWQGAWDEPMPQTSSSDLLSNIREQYMSLLLSETHQVDSMASATYPSIAGIYTPMHGVGWATVAEVALRVNNCTLIPVAEQVDPDPDFPTVMFPNPEEDGALQMSYETADKAGKTIVLANDPDADRFAVAQKIDGSWRRFTGDQVGVLLANYLLDKQLSNDAKHQEAMLCSAVSSGLLERMLSVGGERIYFETTLTGFKWIGNRAKELKDMGMEVLFGYEEALGYMFPKVSWDKDGIAALSTFLTAISHWNEQGLTAWDKLQQIYKMHGYHESINTYFLSPSPSSTKDFFAELRKSDSISNLSLNPYTIVRWRDVTNGTTFGNWQNKLPKDSSSEMLQFSLIEATPKPTTDPEKQPHTEIFFTIRASGTEPKIKLYLECSSVKEDDAMRHADEVFSAIVKNWILPFGQKLTHSGTVISSSNRVVKVELT